MYFLYRFKKKFSDIRFLKKIHPVEAKLFHADRHTPTDGETDRETWWS